MFFLNFFPYQIDYSSESGHRETWALHVRVLAHILAAPQFDLVVKAESNDASVSSGPNGSTTVANHNPANRGSASSSLTALSKLFISPAPFVLPDDAPKEEYGSSLAQFFSLCI